MKISICHGELFEYILYYFYTGKIAVNRANVCELIEVANDMVLPRLRGFCAQFLQQTLNPGNCYFVKNVAEKYQLSLLSKTVHSYILTNFTEIINEKEILNFTADEINLLASNLSMPITEETRLRLVCKWIAADVSSRYTQFDRLISHLQWPLFNTKTVYNVIETEKLFTVSEYCMHGILRALNERGRLPQLYVDTMRHLAIKLELLNCDAVQCGSSLPVDQLTTAQEAKRARADAESQGDISESSQACRKVGVRLRHYTLCTCMCMCRALLVF